MALQSPRGTAICWHCSKTSEDKGRSTEGKGRSTEGSKTRRLWSYACRNRSTQTDIGKVFLFLMLVCPSQRPVLAACLP